MAAIWSIMILSMERAWVVYRVTRVRPAVMRVCMVRVVVTLQWVVALALALPPLLGYNRWVYSVQCTHVGVQCTHVGVQCTILKCNNVQH